MATTLSIEALSAWYGDIQVLWDISLHVNEGELVALIGRNGAGKSTLLRGISGLHPQVSGSILLGGAHLHALPAHRIVGEGVILVPEGRRLFGDLSVLENLELGAYRPRARHARPQTLRRIFDLFPILAERRSQAAGTLSGGEQQMLAIGRALMGLPRLLMLDEPSLGLAPMLIQQVFESVETLNREGVTILLVEQNASRALGFAHRAYIIEEGRIVGSGTGQDLLRDGRVRQAFLGTSAGRMPSRS